MHRLLIALLCLGVSLPAVADKDDAPLPYDDEAASDEPDRPKKSRKSERLRQEDEDAQERDERLASIDDPNYGIGGDVNAGLVLLEASRGGVDPRFTFGLRFTWEWGRLFSDEYLREMFFADVTWRFAVTTDGTGQVAGWGSNHYFTVAPAFSWPFTKSLGVFAQLGLGVDAAFTGVRVEKTEVQLQGARFLLQYGVGLRGRPAILEDETVRLTWRVEITRYLRGYMHDTVFAAGVGVLF
ncbi:MAG: hypothetical protein JNJ54_17175 [Myxococcaceae bacterium]|nr:hypothetical protein [Myxococcaceae bacterium]